MENSTKKYGGVVIPKRKRSLDLKSLYKSRSSEVVEIKKNSSEKNNIDDIEKKKRKIQKEVSLSSFQFDGKKSRENGYGEKSEMVSVKKLTGGNKGLHEILPSLADNAGVFNIPKRPRGSLGRKKPESDQLPKPLRLQDHQLPKPLRLQDSDDRVGPSNANATKPDIESGPNDKLINAGSISAGNSGISKLKSRNLEGRKKLEKERITKPSVLSDSFDSVGPSNASVTKSKDIKGPKDLDTVVSVTAGNGGISKLKSPSSEGRKKLGKERISKPSVLPDSFDHVAPINVNVTKSEDGSGSKDPDKVVAGSDSSGGVKRLHSLGKNNQPNSKSKKKEDLKSNFDASNSIHKLKRKAGGDEIRESKKSRSGLAEKEDNQAVCSGTMSLEKQQSNSSKKKDLVVCIDGKESSIKKASISIREVEEYRNVRSGAVAEEDKLVVNNVYSAPEKQQSKSKKKKNLFVDRDGKGTSKKKKRTSVGEIEVIKNDRVGTVGEEEHLAIDNGHTSPENQRNNSRKQKDLLVGGDSEEASTKKTKPSVDGPVSDGLFVDFLDDDDDEENLEQTAARMLSSRFDPSCTGFSSKKRTYKSETADGFSFPVSSGRDSFNQQANSSSFEDSGSADVKSKALRPRREDKGKHVQRKRRHFYEVLPTDFDALWVVNRRIKIFWPLDESWYVGLVKDYHPEVKLHHIKYDDRDEEWVDLHEETFQLLLLPSEVPGKVKGRKRKTRSKEEDGVKAAPRSDDDSCTGNYLDSEPIASWLARSNLFAKSSPSLKKRTLQMHPHTTPSWSGERTEKTHSLGNVSDSNKQDCESAMANDLEVNEVMLGIVNSSRNGIHLVTYMRKKYKTSKTHSCASIHAKACRNVTPLSPENQLWLVDAKGNVKLNDMLVASMEFRFQTCLAVLPFLEFSHGTTDLWLLHYVFILQHGTVVTTSPAVKMEMIFIDSNHGLRFLSFEGCLRQALAFIFLILTVFSRVNEQCNDDVRIPVTSIRFRILGGQDLREHHVFAFYSFSGLKRSKWLYLDFKLLQQCRLLKQLPVSECTYDNIKNLEDNRRLVAGILPMSISGEACNTRMSLAAKPREVPHFALSSGAASSLFLNLHLQSLMEHSFDSIDLEHHAAPCLTERSENDNQPCGEDPTQAKESRNLRKRKPEGAAFGNNREIHAQMEQDEFMKDVNERTINMGPTSSLRFGSRSGSLAVDIPSADQVDMPCDGKGCVSRQTFDVDCNVKDGFVDSLSLTCFRSPFKHRTSSPTSFLGDLSPMWADGKTNFVHNGFSNGPKKPRTQVSYTMPSTGYDFSGKKMQNQRALPCKRIRRASLKKLSEGQRNGAGESLEESSRTNHKNLESLACGANVLVTQGYKGFRLCGAHVMLEVADRNEWKLAVKFSGITKYSYKVNHIFQPGSTNRFSHAMMWKGGKDWILEFPDRSQWVLFKEMHEECYNRNIRAASVKHIPIPGVRLIDENDDWGTELPFVRNSMKYFRQVQTDVEMTMDPSRVLYDMDSDDEQWLLVNKKCTDKELSEEVLEKTIYMFEKVSCTQQREKFTDAEIEDIVAGVGSLEAAKLIYGHWRQKRERKGMPLVRHLQPPLWVRYQQQLKEWEQTVAQGNGALSIGSQGKVPPPEKPPMFAFCLKPRGLDIPNRGSKQRSHRKFLVSGHHQAASGDHGSLLAFGRRSDGHAFGDEKRVYPLYEYSDVSPSLQASTKGFPDTHFSLNCDASEWNHNSNIYKNRPKKLRSCVCLINQQTMPYNQRTQMNRNPVGQKCHYFEGQNRRRVKQLYGSDLQELRLRDASSASQHARKMAKLKRERAQRLLCRADLCVHKALTAMMTAEAIKAAHESSNCEN